MHLLPILFAFLAGPAEPMSLRAVPVEGAPFAARLDAMEDDWALVFATDEGKRRLPAAELVRFGAPRELLRGPVIVLADGGRLAAEVTGIDKLSLAVHSAIFGPLLLPLEQVAGVVFLLPADLRRQTLLLERLQGADGRVDRVILENGDELTGLIDGFNREQVRVGTPAGPVEIDRRSVAAVVFNPMLRRPTRLEGLHAWLGLSDGSLFLARKIHLDRQRLRVETAAGELGSALPEDLAYLQPMGGRAVYLSTLEPETYRHVPYLEISRPYFRDRNVAGGPLLCGQRCYVTGLGMHTAARITYRLDGVYDRFQSEVGVDDSTDGRGSVRFRVFLDGRERFTGEPIRGGDLPGAIDLDVSGVDRLDLVVDFAEQAHVLDYANWLDARLLLPRGR